VGHHSSSADDARARHDIDDDSLSREVVGAFVSTQLAARVELELRNPGKVPAGSMQVTLEGWNAARVSLPVR
jgi:hypothetical protein